MFLNFLTQLLAKIDIFKAVVVLRSKKKSKIRTRSLGIFTLLLALLFVYLFVERIQKIIRFDLSQINSKQYLSRNQNRSYAQNVMFAISLPSVARRLANNYTEIRKYFQFNAYILYSDDTMYGLANWTKISMVPCSPSHWQAINKQLMQKIKINQYFCLPENLTLLTAEYEKNFLKIQIEKCTSSQICYNKSHIDALISDLIKKQNKITVSIGFKNPFPNINLISLIHEIRQFKFYAGFDLRPNIFLQFRQLRIISDDSFWPVYKSDQINRDIEFQYLIQSFQTPTPLLQPHTIIKFSLALTKNEQIIERNLTKMDEAVSYAGFLFGVTMFGLIFLLRSFNQYRYELHVGQNSFNYDQSGYKVKENQFNIFQYLKYRVYYFISLVTGIFVNWSQCFEVGRTLEEGRKNLDVQYMFRRLGLMQRFVENLYDSNYLDVMTLMRPQTIQTIKNRRLTLSYYQKVITQNFDVLTVDDLFYFSSNKQIKLEPDQINAKISKVDLLCRSKKLICLQEGNEVSSIKFDEENDDYKAQFQQQIVDGLKNSLSLRSLPFICDKIAKYPLIAKNAEEVILSQQQQHVQEQLTQSFINLSLTHKKTLIQKIPLKIIHRLRLKAQEKHNQPTVEISCQKVVAKQKIKNSKQGGKFLSVKKIQKERGTKKLKSQALHILIPAQLKSQRKRKKICFDPKVSYRNSIRQVVRSDQVAHV